MVPVPGTQGDQQHDPVPPAEQGLADIVTLQRRKAAEISEGDEEGFFLDTIAGYQWARDAAGLAQATLDGLVKPVIEVCEHYGLAPWRLAPRHVDRYFAGEGKRSGATVRRKMNQIDGYFAFLEQRYAGEIARRYGVAVESPVDSFNRRYLRGPRRRAARCEDRRPALGIGAVGPVPGQRQGRPRIRPPPAGGLHVKRAGRCCGGGSKKSAAASATTRSIRALRCFPPSASRRPCRR